MAELDDYDKYFQADHSVATQARRAAKSSNKHGNPIRVNKVSALAVDPTNNRQVFVSEATGTVRAAKIDAAAASQPNGKGGGNLRFVLGSPVAPAAPLTSLFVASSVDTEAGGKVRTEVFAGCWDKAIYKVALNGDGTIPLTIFRGAHSDFVKCLAVQPLASPAITLLISGSADRSIVIWDTKSENVVLKLLNHHKTSLTALLIDPLRTNSSQLTFFSSSSDGEIKQTTLSITTATATSTSSPVQISLASQTTLPSAHPTSVYALSFIGDEGDLLTASADGSAAVLNRERGWQVESRFQHGGHVRCVAASADGALVVTGGRDEDVVVWSASDEKEVVRIRGHFDEVMAVAFLDGTRVVSAGLDGTVRAWNVREEVERREKEAVGDEEGDNEKDEGTQGGAALTAEEEAELAELMDDDD